VHSQSSSVIGGKFDNDSPDQSKTRKDKFFNSFKGIAHKVIILINWSYESSRTWSIAK
jgi:hypothetical protein